MQWVGSSQASVVYFEPTSVTPSAGWGLKDAALTFCSAHNKKMTANSQHANCLN